MYSVETLRLAKEWLIAEIESERCIVKESYGIDYVRSLSDERLLWVFCNYPKSFSEPRLLRAKKENGGIRLSHYVPLNGLAFYFFNDQNIGDPSMDIQRLEYLHVLKLNQFPVSEFDRRTIAHYLPEFIERNKFAAGYRNDPALIFEEKHAAKLTLKQIPA
jgi:hypothetical protein